VIISTLDKKGIADLMNITASGFKIISMKINSDGGLELKIDKIDKRPSDVSSLAGQITSPSCAAVSS